MARNTERNRTEAGSQEEPRSRPSGSDMMNRQGSADESDIARRAYRRYEERGFEHGHDVEDWLEAERDVRDESNQ